MKKFDYINSREHYRYFLEGYILNVSDKIRMFNKSIEFICKVNTIEELEKYLEELIENEIKTK